MGGPVAKLARVVVRVPAGATVKTTRRKGNTSAALLLTVNAGTALVIETLPEVAPPAPAPVPPAPVPAPPAPPPAPVPPPVGPTLRTITTNGHTLDDQSRPAVITDTIDLARSMPPVPWTLFRDAAEHVAWPLNGAEPAEWRRLPVYGYPAEYAVTTPAIVGGQLQMLYPGSVNDADPAQLIIPELERFPVRGGARGEAITTPYWLVRGHTRYDNGTLHNDPRIPAWVAVDMIGHVYYLMRDGSTDLVAQVPLESYANDFSYAGDGQDRRVMWVTDTAVGKVLKVTRSGRTFVKEQWCRVAGRATSVRAIGSKLYVCNERHVIEFDAMDRTAAPREVCALPGVFWVDYLSDGRLVVMTRNSAIHVVDPVTGEMGPNINGRDSQSGADYRNATPVGWVMVEVDRAGTCGPKDAIYACASHNQSINGPWRIHNGRITRIPGIGGAGRSLAGRSTTCIEGCHYPWVVALHPDEAMLMVQGGSQILPVIYAAVGPADRSWPAEEPYNHALLARGYQVIRQGGSQPFKTFAASMGASGNSMVGCTPDHIAAMSFDDALAFVRQGMLSVEPRPIADADAYAVLAWLYRGSQRYLREGRPLMDALAAWAQSR